MVFIAGGVGVNPLMSMLSHLAEQAKIQKGLGFEIKFLYSLRDPGPPRVKERILFLERIVNIFEEMGSPDSLRLFLTPSKEQEVEGVKRGGWQKGREDAVIGGAWGEIAYKMRRLRKEDLENALGSIGERGGTVVYVCGVKGMTDQFVGWAESAEGMSGDRVFCERWW